MSGVSSKCDLHQSI